jgi:uncharacterized protein YggE
MDTQSTTQEDKQESLMRSSRVQGTLVLALLLLSAFLFAETIKSLKEYNYVGGAVAPSNVIVVRGEGEVFAVPDVAEFTFSLIEEGETVGAVQEAATSKANEAIDALKEKGVEEKDLRVVAYELRPKYEWETAACVGYRCDRKQVQKGFTLNQSIRVKVRNLDDAGEMLQIVTGKGVQSVSGLTFSIADEDGVKAEARKQAIDEAREKAEKLAGDLDVSLVRIVGFSEGGSSYPQPVYARSESMGLTADSSLKEAAPAIPAGENRIVSNVNITYEIR